MRDAAIANDFERNRRVFDNRFVPAFDYPANKFLRAVGFDVAFGFVADAPRPFKLAHNRRRVEIFDKLNGGLNNFHVEHLVLIISSSLHVYKKIFGW